MKKVIKKYGNTNIIQINNEEMRIYDWEIGGILDLSDCVYKGKVKHEKES